mmetsp:Transcript_9502/g.28882  ORF Transcript_9502/g.28882 Transcript_9502/m.28882 type:complete len:391 (+) Transcript_9502:314-1486(+)
MTCSHPGGSYSNEWPMLFIQHFERALGGGEEEEAGGRSANRRGARAGFGPGSDQAGRWVAHQGLVLGRALLEHVVGSHRVDVGVVWGAEDNEGELDLGAAPAPQLPLHHVARHPEVHQAPVVQGVVPLRLPHLGASRSVAVDHLHLVQEWLHEVQNGLFEIIPTAEVLLVEHHDRGGQQDDAVHEFVARELHHPDCDEASHAGAHDIHRRAPVALLVLVLLPHHLSELDHVLRKVVKVLDVARHLAQLLALPVALKVESMHVTAHLVQTMGDATLVHSVPGRALVRGPQRLVAGVNAVPVDEDDDRGGRDVVRLGGGLRLDLGDLSRGGHLLGDPEGSPCKRGGAPSVPLQLEAAPVHEGPPLRLHPDLTVLLVRGGHPTSLSLSTRCSL